ncbi:fumarylacetoacetate hydrolase family protein [Georgenia sp. EYE_87]|uniref:fumarylacetoacetate hydrolase family protein n=1 Tax=Georgenia sp. EYE_87 TaxID=2853448 RepID=UPI002004596B|nr:fumarylacetoacetate hydrolase family protein [Georgenia sp. EYE_87]MCK6211069.1 fumarylacetoacetate hydrolase family protein [Georgenia sp. EYE_87]
MRYASYVNSVGVPTWGAEESGVLYDLGPSGLALAPSLKVAIAGGSLQPAPHLAAAPAQPVEGTAFLPVISDPGKVICVGVNYKTHQEETGRADVVAPTIFTRFADTLAAHGEDLPIPTGSEKYDYEGEVALVIGAPAYQVSLEASWDVVAGYAAFNDLSARDWQRHTGQWTPGKNFPASGPFGPYYTPASELGEVTDLVVETRVNGEVRQHAKVLDLIFDIPSIIEYVTAFTPLAPGDVIVTGTPGGVGLFMEPPVFLSPGDVVEVEVTGLGTLRNRLVAANHEL